MSRLPPFQAPRQSSQTTVSAAATATATTIGQNISAKISSCLAIAKENVAKALGKQAAYPHTPSSNPGTLNYPFQPAPPPSVETNQDTSSSMEPEVTTATAIVDSGDIELLEKQVIKLEASMKNFLNEGDNPTRTARESSKSSPASLEGLNGIFTCDGLVRTNKLPVSVYAELIAIYDNELNGMGPCYPTRIDRGTSTPRNSDPRNNCNKERNVRNEVLKWNKE